MRRQTILLLGLAAVLVVAMYWLLLFRPQQVELADVRAQVDAQIAQQAQLEGQLVRLRGVRAGAPEIEAELAAIQAILPEDAALPPLLRQLQAAADDAGVVLQTITTTPPQPVVDAATPLSAVGVNLQAQGNYFQIVDYLRRIEDPAITPRGVLWESATVTRQAYPLLTVTLAAQVFAQQPAEPIAEDPTVDPELAEQLEDLDVGLDIDIDVEGDS
ncbi:MAG TPA: type II secretion system protein GspM [Egicoccus sp.]|nr:type II secretion system protein GspM [Egicoccus sp.]HSK21854.1 type II secretion system protein GspM [Egicoccus sp.]